MQHDWIIDVLADLKSYARKNGLVALVKELDEATLLAATEIASTQKTAPLAAGDYAGSTGYIHRATGTGPRA
jgi:hypothetical protein